MAIGKPFGGAMGQSTILFQRAVIWGILLSREEMG